MLDALTKKLGREVRANEAGARIIAGVTMAAPFIGAGIGTVAGLIAYGDGNAGPEAPAFGAKLGAAVALWGAGAVGYICARFEENTPLLTTAGATTSLLAAAGGAVLTGEPLVFFLPAGILATVEVVIGGVSGASRLINGGINAAKGWAGEDGMEAPAAPAPAASDPDQLSLELPVPEGAPESRQQPAAAA